VHQLPPLTPAIRVLKAEESDRLESLFSDIPRSLDECVTCAGKKTFKWYDNYGSPDAQIVDYECPCSDQIILSNFLRNAGIGKQGQRISLGDCQEVPVGALEAIANYIEQADYYVTRGMGLLFHGQHGTGKTLLVTILAKQLLAEGVDGYFTTFNGMLDNFASGWRDDKNRQWFEKRIRNAPLLVVDDIGRENKNLNNMASNALDTVFRSRVQNSLPTIITTNLNPSDFEKSYSSGVMGLVTETSLTYEFLGESFREKQRERSMEEARLFLSRPITVS
jgi:DNA replication protein DnaC